MLLHYFALIVAASTALLILAGGMMTGSGLAVPGWPGTCGWFTQGIHGGFPGHGTRPAGVRA